VDFFTQFIGLVRRFLGKTGVEHIAEEKQEKSQGRELIALEAKVSEMVVPCTIGTAVPHRRKRVGGGVAFRAIADGIRRWRGGGPINITIVGLGWAVGCLIHDTWVGNEGCVPGSIWSAVALRAAKINSRNVAGAKHSVVGRL